MEPTEAHKENDPRSFSALRGPNQAMVEMYLTKNVKPENRVPSLDSTFQIPCWLGGVDTTSPPATPQVSSRPGIAKGRNEWHSPAEPHFRRESANAKINPTPGLRKSRSKGPSHILLSSFYSQSRQINGAQAPVLHSHTSVGVLDEPELHSPSI